MSNLPKVELPDEPDIKRPREELSGTIAALEEDGNRPVQQQDTPGSSSSHANQEGRRPPFTRAHKISRQGGKFHLLVGVTGSVATIKLAELIEQLYKVCMKDTLWIKVSDLKKWADCMLIAPLDANTLAKLANGLADNLLTCIVRAWDSEKPLHFAPAMNTYMWENPLTFQHRKILRELLRYKEIPPIERDLMCGEKGMGAMASIQLIASIIASELTLHVHIRVWIPLVVHGFPLRGIGEGKGSRVREKILAAESGSQGDTRKEQVANGTSRFIIPERPARRAPGRTVTIIPSEGGNCWGIAYKVAAENEAATIDYLNHREKAGYTCQKLSFFPDNKSESFEVLTYISAAGENEFHTGHTEEEEIAQNILVCRGPSGTNIEYALRLAHLLRANLPHADDNHVFAVERVLRKLAGENREAKDLIKCIDEKYAKD